MKKIFGKKFIVILAMALLLTVSVGSTVAYIFTGTDAVENVFTPAKVACAVVENGKDTENTGGIIETVNAKTNVMIKNTGDTDAYIRVAVVVNWMSADGTRTWAQKPAEGVDYALKLAETTAWVKGSDGYYYYTAKVAPEGLTDILIQEATALKAAPQDGYCLSVEIVASAIQATSVAVNDWSGGVATAAADGAVLSVRTQ